MNGLLKFILYSAILYTVDFLSAEFHYEPRWLPALVALFLAVVGHFADRWVLPSTGDPPGRSAGRRIHGFHPLGGGPSVSRIRGDSGRGLAGRRFCWESRSTDCTGLIGGPPLPNEGSRFRRTGAQTEAAAARSGRSGRVRAPGFGDAFSGGPGQGKGCDGFADPGFRGFFMVLERMGPVVY